MVAAPTAAAHAHRRGTRTVRQENSLNLIRLVLAALVLVSHAFLLGGFGPEPRVAGQTLGTWAVHGFFAISGYLIIGSRFSHRMVPYLLKRVARIMPGFLVCNVVVAFAVAPVAWLLTGGSLPRLFAADDSPVDYVVSNAALWIHQYDIAGGPAGVPYPHAWNGSLWSLYYEFVCYLTVGVLALHPGMRKPRVVAGILTVAIGAWGVLATLGVTGQPKAIALLLSLFLGGALLQTLARRGLVVTAPGALLAALGLWGLIALAGDWGPLLSAPLLAYLLIWLSTVLPSPTLVRRHDISYGCYIYAFPVQQLLATVGLHRAGIVTFVAVTAAVTTGLAVLSWRHVESPSLRLAARLPRLRTHSRLRTHADGPRRPRLQLEPGTVAAPVATDHVSVPTEASNPALAERVS
ncbi:MAG TPA: acyltransferase [Pedococcus sp.]|jgi:peptidoglycan/LPS O-acetylase OafA/YrhL|nr:acyltransferase [Pedococcus sp.]